MQRSSNPARWAQKEFSRPSTVSCELQVVKANNAVMLWGVALSNKNVVDTYELRLNKVGQSGRATINQGGQFNAQAGIPEELGSVTLDAVGTDYIAMLTTASGERTTECNKRIQVNAFKGVLDC